MSLGGAGVQIPGWRPSGWVGAILYRLVGMSAAIAFALVAGLLQVIPGVAQPGYTKIFIDSILSPERVDWLRPLLLVMAGTLVMVAGLGFMQRQTFLRQTLKGAMGDSAAFMTHALRLPYAFFTRFHGGEVGLRGQYIEIIAKIIVEDITATAVSCLTIALYALVMLQFDVLLTLLGVFMALLNLVILKFAAGKSQRLFTSFVAEQGKARAAALHGLQIIETLKACGREAEFFGRWAGLKAYAKNIGQHYSLWEMSLRQIPILLTSLSMAVVLGVGALRVMDGGMSIGMLAAFQALLIAFIAPVQQLVNSSANVLTLRGYIERVEEVMQHPLDPLFLNPRPRGLVLPGVGVRLGGEFELRNLTFGYSATEPPLIRDFSLKVAAGSRVALVGGSGSGKSTIVRLIAQLYRPWSGEIWFDAIPRSDIPPALFASSVAFVDQEIFLFEGTVRDNLTLWNPAILDKDIVQAAKDAAIHEVIASRPQAYHAEMLTGGANFSGGQKQRLEIARALASNPSILILDEATSALDAETEEHIDACLRRRGMTCLIVAHRLSTIRDADEIIVMDRGAIVERGTHEELMAAGGHYAQLLVT